MVELADAAKAEVASAIAEIGDEDLACPREIWYGSDAGDGPPVSN
jgi:4-hydroxy-tetrahydrodipicolinate synthase